MIKIGILTSSRADYGIYLPLIEKLVSKKSYDCTIIAFGMHLLDEYGYTRKEIKYRKVHEIHGINSEETVTSTIEDYGNLIKNFAKYWDKYRYDLIFCLGDRIEMSAAIQSLIPLKTSIAHLHGGEITTGSLDNIYRYQISLASEIHFVSTLESKKNLAKYVDKKNIYNVGSLSLDGLKKINLLNKKELHNNYNIPNGAFCLVTFHSDTIYQTKNRSYVKIIEKVLNKLSEKIYLVITYPNNDIHSSLYIDMYKNFVKKNSKKCVLIKSFGKVKYFSAMASCEFMLGNSSSGIIEAASFRKHFINVGSRQNGRVRSTNTIDVDFKYNDIIKKCFDVMNNPLFTGKNKYYKKNVAESIIKIINKNYGD